MAEPYYQDEYVTLYYADCRDVLPDLSADVLVTDPPYGISHNSAAGAWAVKGAASWAGQSIAGDADTALRDEVLSWWGQGRPALVFGTWKRPRPPVARAVLMWDKGPQTGMGDLSLPWKPNWEEIYVLGPGFTGSRDPGVLHGHTLVTWESKGRGHPHEKPVSLLRYLISKCPSGVVLDPFAGSGTTLRAAKDLCRQAVGIEVEERYCELIAARLAQDVLDFGGAA